MRKVCFTIIILVSVCQFVLSQSDIQPIRLDTADVSQEIDEKEGAHPWKQTDKLADKYARWSLAVDAGFDFFTGDMRNQPVDVISTSRIRPYGGLFLNCDFTPVLGLGIGYSYANYGGKRTVDDWLVYGHLHSLEAVLTVDLVDAWNYRRQNTICSWYLLAGGGAGYYSATFNDGINPVVTSGPGGAYSWCGFATVGTLLEFNLSRSFALGLKAEYHINMTDNLDALALGSTNDHMFLGSLQLRWKIGAVKHNHIRNISTATHNYIDGGGRRGGRYGGGGLMSDTVAHDTLIVAGTDTIYLARETERIIERHKIESVQIIDAKAAAYNSIYNVYFANDKDNLDRFALQEIQKVASILEEDTSLCVAVTGYSDNTASQSHNESLSKRRAKKVCDELTNVYKLDSERVVSMGLGIIRNTNASYAPNRRVEMRIVSPYDIANVRQYKDSIENLYNTQQVDKTLVIKNTQQNKDVPKISTLSTRETVDTIYEKHKETVTPPVKFNSSSKNAIATKPLATETVDDNTTLMSLAKKHYGDGDFWPFIYEANKNKIVYPTRLKRGTELVIPRLTEKQKKMSKKALEQLANKYLQ